MSNYINKLSATLRKVNCMLLLMRGNHDDPAYFQDEKIDFPLMKTIPDYSVIWFGGHNILCVGGATSIDRFQRQTSMWLASLKGNNESKCYWENEAPIFNPVSLFELVSGNIQIDSVVTHSAPSFCMPTTKSGVEAWIQHDNALADDLDRERAIIDELYNRLVQDGNPLTNWFYGHYHDSYTEYISGIRFQMLDIMELYQLCEHPATM